MTTMMPLTCQRHLFDIPQDIAYFDCATMSPLLLGAHAASCDGQRRELHPWSIRPDDWFADGEAVRSAASRLVSSSPDDIALIPGASYGVAIAAANVPVAKGQEILILAGQHTANAYSWHRVARDTGATVREVHRSKCIDWTTAVLEAISPATALAALPHVHSTDGSPLDLVAIALALRARGAALIVDATHSLGAREFDVRAIQPDFMVAGGYKWLLGPYGTGLMYVAPAYHAGKSIEEPGLNRLGSENFEGNLTLSGAYRPGARRYDVASKGNFGLMTGLRFALEQLERWTIASVERSLVSMTKQISDRLQELPLIGIEQIHAQSHYVGAKISEHRRKDLTESLARAGVHASIRGEWLRVTPHVYNSQRDIDRLIGVLADNAH
jgi:selenocysteine lyase/cysteine desulfurase